MREIKAFGKSVLITEREWKSCKKRFNPKNFESEGLWWINKRECVFCSDTNTNCYDCSLYPLTGKHHSCTALLAKVACYKDAEPLLLYEDKIGIIHKRKGFIALNRIFKALCKLRREK